MMKRLLGVALLLLVAVVQTAQAEEKPFAEKRVVLQISDSDPFKQTLVLNVASNLIKHYGRDKVDIEIVAFGPGLRLMFKDNANKGRIKGLAENSGVRFSACKNTIRNMSKKLGEPVQLDGHVVPVTAGVVRILDLVADGYTLVKP